MKKAAVIILGVLVLSFSVPMVFAKGYDEYGYNYKANMFNGWLENYNRPDTPVERGEIRLIMKWNDAWLDENKVRHDGYDSYDGSGAWLTNHMWGINEDGSKWEYFVKIITPSTAEGDYVVDDAFTLPTGEVTGMWYDINDNAIGYQIWGAFAVIQEFENNYHADYNPDGINHYVWYKSVSPLGFGAYPSFE